MHTVQILVEEEGNREVISGFLDDTYEIVTATDVQEADAYLVEDSIYRDYQDELRQKVQAEQPVFRPVIMIRGTNSRPSSSQQDVNEGGAGSPVVDIIEAPVRAPVLRRRLASLLGRREQSQELQQKMEQMERQRDALDVLNEMVRHDIRNDLQVVLSHSQLLSEYVGVEGEDVLEAVLSATEEAIELTTEAGELTDFLLAEDPEIGTIQIDDVVKKEIAAARNSNPDITIDYQRPDTDLTVTADQMLSSVVRNLVTNAIRHNDADKPRVSVSISQIGDTVSFSVADNGPGVPDEEKENIFGQGATGDESPGTGIGLYLVSAIVDRYGGEVRVEDSEYNGAEFIVELSRDE